MCLSRKKSTLNFYWQNFNVSYIGFSSYLKPIHPPTPPPQHQQTSNQIESGLMEVCF